MAKSGIGLHRLPLPASGLALGLTIGAIAVLVVGETPFIYFQF